MTHPFEATLGPGPYKFVGMFYISKPNGARGLPYYEKALVHANFKAGAGTCVHCGTAILNVCQVKTASGDVFGVGIDCVQKVGLPYAEMSQIEKAKKVHDKKVRLAKSELKIMAKQEELRELVEKNQEQLTKMPHPNEYFASQGKNLVDYASFFLKPKSKCDGALAKIKELLVQEAKKQDG